MRLRKQLFVVSLVTLGLPWVGCQSVREMDNVLRDGQTQSLTATARAVAARIQSDPQLKDELENSAPQKAEKLLYAHSLTGQNYLDGYSDDWLSAGLSLAPLDTQPDDHEFIAGRWRDHFNAFISVKRQQLNYFNPATASLSNTDHIVVHLEDRERKDEREAHHPNVQNYAVYASGPGQAHVSRLNTENKQITAQQREHRIKAQWLESPDGFQVEIRLPWELAKHGINFSLDKGESAITRTPALRPLIHHSESLTQELSVFSSGDIRLHILSPQQYVIASAGAIHIPSESLQPHGFLTWLYTLALGNRTFQSFSGQSPYGQILGAEIEKAGIGIRSGDWYMLGNHVLARVAEPIRDAQGNIKGIVVAEQSVSSTANMANHAFSQLLAYSFLASMIAALCLVFYATWLSLRIRKLNDAAANAINESGKIAENFPVLGSRDELGELSKSYAQLLTRLREYTHYLRTLSSKLSHELRTPLAIVKSSLDNLEYEPLGDQAKIYAERAREGAARLSSILNAMSAASRVEQAIEGSERERIPCDELLKNLKAAYEDVYQEVDFQLKIRKDGKGLHINGSAELLVQALDKLVDNAADFCPKDGLVELGLYRHQDFVIFTVRNEGPPLPSHMHGQLFDSMVSVRDKTPAEGSHHLGLGLYIVSLITDFHNGEVQGYNVPDNSGVIFELRLPAS